MSLVRQAHMPGNYEMFDSGANRLGPVVCKLCWEGSQRVNSADLNTVWVSFKERPMVWWLCTVCTEDVRMNVYEGAVMVRSARGVTRNPGLAQT